MARERRGGIGGAKAANQIKRKKIIEISSQRRKANRSIIGEAKAASTEKHKQ